MFKENHRYFMDDYSGLIYYFPAHEIETHCEGEEGYGYYIAPQGQDSNTLDTSDLKDDWKVKEGDRINPDQLILWLYLDQTLGESKASEVLENLESYTYWDGHNFRTIILASDQGDTGYTEIDASEFEGLEKVKEWNCDREIMFYQLWTSPNGKSYKHTETRFEGYLPTLEEV